MKRVVSVVVVVVLCYIALLISDHVYIDNITCRCIEAALSSKSSQTSSSSTPSKSSQASLSSFPATDQSAVQEDGDGIRWNTTGDHASTGSASKAGHIYLGKCPTFTHA